MEGDDAISVLEERHMVRLLLHLHGIGKCRKTELYAVASDNPRSAHELDSLEEAGLITMTLLGSGNRTEVSMTDKGDGVSEHLLEILRILSEE